jgi:3',5'-cyclic AMP phosphodiesterase CpdA
VRTWPIPDGTKTIHCVGDLHTGAGTQTRRDIMAADVATGQLPTPFCRVQVGDLANTGITSEDTTAKAFMSSLGGTYYAIVGNHDIWQNVRTSAQWAAAYGFASQNYVVDAGFATLVFVGPDTLVNYPPDTTTMILSQPTLDWLDNQLAIATKDCWVFCHAPLRNTVVGPTSGFGAVWSSAEDSFYVQPDTSIRTILNAQPRAKAWISGHTHSPITAPGFVKAENVGTRSVAAINCSAIYYTGRTVETYDPIISVYLTRTSTGSIEVRYRDHGAGVWTGPGGGARVTTVTPT